MLIYLDNAATSFPKPDKVVKAVADYMTNIGASPGRGAYSNAMLSSDVLYNCQEAIGKLFSIKHPEKIIFTKNATEAINLAMLGLCKKGDEVIISSMEHNSVARCAHFLSRNGIKLKIAHGTPNGKVLPESIEKLISPDTKLIVLIHASNVTGTLNDIYTVQKIAKKHNVRALFDLSQSAGIIPVDASGLDMIAFPGHKGLLGPTGTGCLYLSDSEDISPLLYGGTGSLSEIAQMPTLLPDRFHAGTLNISGIAGLLEAVNFVSKEGVFEKEAEITRYLYTELKNLPFVTIPGEEERSSVVSIVVKGYDCVTLADKLDSEFSISSRAGLHCAPMAHRTIGTISTGTLRLSPGFFTQKSDIDLCVSALKKIVTN